MPNKNRHTVIDLGSVAAGEYTPEVDCSSHDFAILMVENTAGATNTITPYASPSAYSPLTLTFDTPLDIVSISTAAVPVVEVTGHGIATGTRVKIEGLADDNSTIDNRVFTITSTGVDTFTIANATQQGVAGVDVGTVKAVTSDITPLWFLVGTAVAVTSGQNWAFVAPSDPYSLQTTPSRMKFLCSGTANVWIELVREIE